MFSPLVNTIHVSRNYTNASRSSAEMDVVVIHTMESPEGATTAEDVAAWFAGPTAPRASAHYCVDVNSIVGCVHEEDVAWAAPGNNHNGIQIELAGRAGQTAAQWNDAFSRHELDRAARLVADICKRRNIPIKHLTNNELRDGRRGIIGHVQASEVWKQSTHWDPGPNFPWFWFMERVRAFANPAPEYVYQIRVGGKPIVSASSWIKLFFKVVARRAFVRNSLNASLTAKGDKTGMAGLFYKSEK